MIKKTNLAFLFFAVTLKPVLVGAVTILMATRQKKTATLSDVARLAGTAKGTASRALNGRHWVAPETREAVMRAAQELGFRADPTAQTLASGRRSTLVGLFAHSFDLGTATLKLQRLQKNLNEKGYDAPIHACGSSVGDADLQAQALSNLCRQRPAAIICNTNSLQNITIQLLQKYSDSGGVLVLYDTPLRLQGNTVDYVVFDREDNTYQATRHVLELGHRDIGLSDGGARDSERSRGFERALQEFGLEFDDKATLLEPLHLPSGRILLAEERGWLMGESFVRQKVRPTAVCIPDDNVAAGFISAVQNLGLRVPDDVSVVGQDNMPIAAYACAVPLTTVSQPVDAIAQECVALIDSRLKGEYTGESRRSILCGELIVRKSTKAISS